MNQLEEICFEIITNVGMARSSFLEGIALAREGKWDLAEEKRKEGEEYFIAGHHVHMKLISMEANQELDRVPLLLIHAEDQLMSAEGFKILFYEFLELYKKLDKAGI